MSRSIACLLLVGASCLSSPKSTDLRFGATRSAVAPTLSPANVTLAQGQTQQFTATGTGPYTWALQPSPSGSIDSTGLYTAGSPGSTGATDTVTVTDTGAGSTTATATVTISKGVNAFNNGGAGNGVIAGNGFAVSSTSRVERRVAQTFTAAAPVGGDTQAMATLAAVDMVRASGGSGQNIKAEIHSLTGTGNIDDQGAGNAYSSGTISALSALPTPNVKTRVLIPLTPGTALTVGTTYALVLKADVAGTLSSFVSETPLAGNGGWWYAKRVHIGGWVARGVYATPASNYIHDTTYSVSGNVFLGEIYTSPTTSSISPTSASVNAAGFTLTVNGTNFFASSTVNWNGSARTTTYVNATQLTATIPGSDLTSAGTNSVTVATPAPGGGTSGAQTFSANNPSPTVSSLNPTNVNAGTGALTLTVNGSNFVSGATVNWAGSARTTTYVSGTKLTASLTSSDVASAGSFSVTVTNPTPGGGTSSAATFTVNSAGPTYVTGNSIGFGYYHACTIVNGGVQCWGYNTYGEIGNNSTTDVHTPVAVTGLGSGAQLVVNGAYSSCAIVNGGAQCWGRGWYGELGNNSTADAAVTTPVQVVGLTSGVQDIKEAYRSGCALVNGGVQCWGNNQFGDLGNNSVSDSSVPVQVYGLSSGVQAIAKGEYHTCALVNGGVQCWGRGQQGQLGNNATADNHIPVQVTGLPAGSGVQAIATGDYHSCAIVNGSAQCWGNNSSRGDLGNNSTAQSNVPVQVLGLTAGVDFLGLGTNLSCAIADGSAKCWGWNSNGQLGNNSVSDSLVPMQVLGLTGGATAIAAGAYSACAIVNGAVKCWGSNSNGYLGDNTVTERHVPVQVVGLTSGLLAATTGKYNGCAIVNGGVQCWGHNHYGQLGNNSTSDTHVPTKADASVQSGVQSVTSAFYGSCAIVNGAALCWGRNAFGQLGNNTCCTQSNVPVQVLGLTSGVQAVVTNENEDACAIVNGSAQCWGYGAGGQLGNNATSNQYAPVQVTGLTSGVQQLSGTNESFCALANGGVQCWGRNNYGELGNGSIGGSSNTPVAVAGLTSGVKSISCSQSHCCAVASGGLQCWGSNGQGQLGNNDTSNSGSAVQVSGIAAGAQQIASGGDVGGAQAVWPYEGFTCALINGGVQCFGGNSFSQLGNASTTQSLVPVQTSSLASGAQSVSSGGSFACALVGGSVQCWGANNEGELGNNSTTSSNVPVTVSAFQ